MTYGVDSTGTVAPTTAELRAETRAFIASRLSGAGFEAIDWDNDLTWAVLVDAAALMGGKIAQYIQAATDATNPAAATGVHLDDIGAIRGTGRQGQTYSTAQVELSGMAATVVPIYKVMKDSAGYFWEFTEEATVHGGDFDVRCLTPGAISLSGALTPVTVVSGWTSSAYTASSLLIGKDREAGPAYRLRQERSLANPGQLNAGALRGRVLELSWVTHCTVVNNPSASTTTSSGVTLDPHSFGVIVYPVTPTDAQKTSLAETIYRWSQSLGTGIMGSESATVTREDGQTESVAWSYASSLAVVAAVTVTAAAGYTVASLTTGIQEAIADYFSLYAEPGRAIYDSEVECYVSDQVQGIRRIVVTLDGGTSVAPTAVQLPTLSGTPTVS